MAGAKQLMKLIPWYLLNWPWPFKVDIFHNLQTIWHLTLFHWGKGEKIKPFHKKIYNICHFLPTGGKKKFEDQNKSGCFCKHWTKTKICCVSCLSCIAVVLVGINFNLILDFCILRFSRHCVLNAIAAF